MTFLQVVSFLAAHHDLIEDVVEAVENGVTKDAIKKAVRDLKVAVSDAAIQEELQLPFNPNGLMR